jgi:hypothetical protein
VRPIAAKRDKRTEIRFLEERVKALLKRRESLTDVRSIRINIHRVAEARMRISILKGELEF